ncbi:Pancreatic triacylglycerol lipase [Apis cerana cerana]|uniref:phospholipase A1 n=1 Tax=Apis cerana cerana TaxID=94128 RepID=A0A2A3E4Q1_APICC|nr:Pancreatic triacylglycerol lipase [Apis cerana cerana]
MKKNNKIIIFINGWNEEINSEDVQLITNNVLALDYRNVSKEFYIFAIQHIYEVGKSVAAALDNMVENGINSKNIHIIGHSLGSELSGIIGRNMNYKIGRITGLDPAGPGYYILNTHLSTSDAEFVDVIHTDMSIFGLALKIGHVDFFPNYGHRPQPGCMLLNDDFCSHHRSYKFYAESVKNHNAFIGKCHSLNECNGIEYIPMGYVTPSNATGNYYLITNSMSPFGRVFFICFSADTMNMTDFTENVFLRLYNRNGSYIDKNIRNANQLLPYIQKDNNLIFYLTGYTYNIDSDNVKMITNAYLYNTQDNILALDYRDITNQTYLLSVIIINHLSTFIANVLNNLVNNGVNPEKIHLIGHSLGAQLAARIGRKTNFKIPRITALDPAGPLYYIFDSHITSSDAKFVDVIHTDMGFYGLGVKVGHVDFFPNYGHRPQPGCKIIGPILSTQDFCSHSRSFEYYAESVKNNNAFIAKCRRNCNGTLFIPMGYSTPSNARGNYNLLTNERSPYGRGLKGVINTS